MTRKATGKPFGDPSKDAEVKRVLMRSAIKGASASHSLLADAVDWLPTKAVPAV